MVSCAGMPAQAHRSSDCCYELSRVALIAILRTGDIMMNSRAVYSTYLPAFHGRSTRNWSDLDLAENQTSLPAFES